MVRNLFFPLQYGHFLFQMYLYDLRIFEVHFMSLGQKLAMLKIRFTSVTFLSFGDVETTPEETK